VVEAHINAGWIDKRFRQDEMEAAVRTICEPIFQRPLDEISFAAVLMQVFQIARRFDFEVQPQLILLHKTLLNIEGLGRQLYPQLDLWETAQPFFERWMSEQLGPRAVLRHLKRELPRWGELLPELPALHHQLLRQAVTGKLQLASRDQHSEALQQEVRRAGGRAVLAIAGAALLIAIVPLLPPDQLGTKLLWIAVGTGLGLMLAAIVRR